MTSFASNFDVNFNNRNADENWMALRDRLKEIASACLPLTKIKTGINDPWFTREVKTCLNKKAKSVQEGSKDEGRGRLVKLQKKSVVRQKLKFKKLKINTVIILSLIPLEGTPKKFGVC